MFFENCKNKDELRQMYRKLAHLLHPDKGGSNELMMILNKYFEICEETFEKDDTNYGEKLWEKYKNACKENNMCFIYEKTDEPIYETDPRSSILENIEKYASKHPKFKLDYLETVQDYMDRNKFITAGQYNALVKTWNAFRMYDEIRPERS